MYSHATPLRFITLYSSCASTSNWTYFISWQEGSWLHPTTASESRKWLSRPFCTLLPVMSAYSLEANHNKVREPDFDLEAKIAGLRIKAEEDKKKFEVRVPLASLRSYLHPSNSSTG